MSPNNLPMETALSNDPSSPESTQNDPDNRDYCGLPPIARTRPLSNEANERLSNDAASTGTLCPSRNDQSGSARSQSPQEEPLPRQTSALQDQTVLLRHGNTTMQTQSAHASTPSTTSSHRGNSDEAGQDTQEPMPKVCSWKDKLGTFAISILIAGSVLLCAAVGTLGFLWFGNSEIPAWKEITARNWLSKAISICTGVIQQVMMLQLGIVTAAIASLALESRHVVIGDVASVSVMRATASSTGAFVMAWQCLAHGQYRGARQYRIFLLVCSAATLWCLSQFLVLILLTDVSARSTAGLDSTINLPYNLHYTGMDNGYFVGSSQFIESSIGAWNRKVSQYASFAEYTEPPYEADGISDTGVTLRAFLPLRTAQERENLRSYKGKATVLDSRVSCQVPQFKNAKLNVDGGRARFRGSLAPTRETPRLANATLGISNSADTTGLRQDRWRDFDCFLDASTDWTEPGGFVQGSSNDEWHLTLCQLWQSDPGEKNWGGLVSEFFDPSQMDETPVYAKPYLLLNNTWSRLRWKYTNGDSEAYDSKDRGEWKELYYYDLDFSFTSSICYAAFDLADIDVQISSQSNRTEWRLMPVFDRETSTYNFAELRHTMGQDSGPPLDRRGILELEKQQWQTVSKDNYTEYTALSWLLRSVTDMTSTTTNSSTGVMSVNGICADCAQIEVMHQWLFQEILRTNGSVAFALQTMITVLSSMSYYEQMGQFDKLTQAELSFFKPAQVPVGCAGFTVVVLTVTWHCILMAYCILLFLRNTTSSRLGASWSAVAQVATGDVLGYLKHATLADDNDFQARLKADGLESSKVHMEEVRGEVSISISGKDEEK